MLLGGEVMIHSQKERKRRKRFALTLTLILVAILVCIAALVVLYFVTKHQVNEELEITGAVVTTLLPLLAGLGI